MAKKKMYHATLNKNLISILRNGLNPGCDGLVYLTEKEEECIRFPYILGIKEVVTIEVLVDASNIIETFDHSYEFYKCKCYGHIGKIDAKNLRASKKYEF